MPFKKYFSSVLQVIKTFFLNISDIIKTEAVLSFLPKKFKNLASVRLAILQIEKKINFMSIANHHNVHLYYNILIKERLIFIHQNFLGIEISKIQ